MNKALEGFGVRLVGKYPPGRAYRVRIRNSMIPNKSPSINHGITGSDEFDVRKEGIKVQVSVAITSRW